MSQMTRRERLAAAVKGDAVDRPLMCFYNHNHAKERSPALLVPHLAAEQEKFGWDFIKAMARATYYCEAWGCEYHWNPDTPWTAPVQTSKVLETVEDLKKLSVLKGTEGPFGEHVQAVKMLREIVGPDIPIVQSIFNPLSILNRMAGAVFNSKDEAEPVKRFIRQNPQALHQALDAITRTLSDYTREVIRAGADGIFMTTTVFTRDHISEAEYAVFGKPYDLAVLQAAAEEGAWANVLHICRHDIFFAFFSEYPVPIINYESTSPRNPDLHEARRMTGKILWGGVDQRQVLPGGTPETVKRQVREALDATGGEKFILGPGCTANIPIPDGNLQAAKEAVLQWKRMP